MTTIDIPMSDAMRQLTLSFRLTGVRIAAARLWLGCQVIKLAALIIGCGVEIETKERS